MKCQTCGKHFQEDGRPLIVICGIAFCSECITSHSQGPSTTIPTRDVGCRPSREACRTREATDGEAVTSRVTGRMECGICGRHFRGDGRPLIVICGIAFCCECITSHSQGPSTTIPAMDVEYRPSREGCRARDDTDGEAVTTRATGRRMECEICGMHFQEDGRPPIVICGIAFCSECINSHSQDPSTTIPSRNVGSRPLREACRTRDATDGEAVTSRVTGRMECGICRRHFRGEGRPTIVICGIAFCSECITSHSPSCYFRDLGCRFSREAIRNLDETDGENETSLSARELSDRMASLKQDQSALLDDSSSDCNEILSQLEGYNTSLQDLMSAHDEHITKLLNCVKHHQDVQSILEQSKKGVRVKQREGKDHHHRVQLASEQLRGAKSASEVVISIDKADREMTSMQQWAQKCRKLFPDTKAVFRSIKMQKATKNALEAMTQDGEVFPRLLDSLPMQVVFNEKYNISDTVGKMAELVNETQSIKKLVESGQLIALQHQNGCFRYAKITLDGDNFCLHHLQDEPPTAYAFTVKFEAALARAVFSGLAFLDLSFGGSPPRRVYVRMDPQKHPDLAKQFLYMCTGASGPSFADTFLHVQNQGQDQEMLVGGDSDSQGRPSIFQGQVAADVGKSWTEGLVGAFPTASNPTKFFITIRNSKNSKIHYIFGKVEKGLHTAKEAAQSADAAGIKVVNCGVVL